MRVLKTFEKDGQVRVAPDFAQHLDEITKPPRPKINLKEIFDSLSAKITIKEADS